MEQINNDSSCRSWFLVLNNPENQLGELKPEEIVKAIIEIWIQEHPKGFAAANYEIGGKTGNKHCHIVLGDKEKVRFSNIKKLFPNAHIEPTKGLKKDAMDYIFKRGKFEEKAHLVIVPPVIHGELQSNRKEGGSVFNEIDEMIADGMTPNAIMKMGSRYVRYETAIRGAYFLKRSSETPERREVTVNYHCGLSGTGKSYEYIKLCEEFTSDMIYFASDHSEKGCFDLYNGEPILFLDELRYMKYNILLSILHEYKGQIHCRYKNAVMLWNRVEIASVLPLESLYENIVPLHQRQFDSYEQLKRRITNVVFHYVENGEYRTYIMPGTKYVNFNDLKNKAMGTERDFVRIEDSREYEQLEIPFIN